MTFEGDTVSDSTYDIIALTFNATTKTVIIHHNGTSYSTQDDDIPDSFMPDGIVWFGFWQQQFSHYASAYIAERVMYDGVKTDGQINTICNILKNKYDLTWTDIT